MLKSFKKLWNSETGSALIIAGAALPMIVGAAGLATDTAQWVLWKRELQRAADSAAIAGVYERNGGSTTAETTTAVGHDLDLNQHTGIDLYEEADVQFPATTATCATRSRCRWQFKRPCLSAPFS